MNLLVWVDGYQKGLQGLVMSSPKSSNYVDSQLRYVKKNSCQIDEAAKP